MGEFEEWLKVCTVFLGLDSQGSPCVDFRIWGCYKSGFSTITLFKILVSVQNSHVQFNIHVQTSLLIAHDCTWLPPFAMTGLRESLVDTCRWCRWWTPASPFSLLGGGSSDCDWGDSHLIWTNKKWANVKTLFGPSGGLGSPPSPSVEGVGPFQLAAPPLHPRCLSLPTPSPHSLPPHSGSSRWCTFSSLLYHFWGASQWFGFYICYWSPNNPV